MRARPRWLQAATFLAGHGWSLVWVTNAVFALVYCSAALMGSGWDPAAIAAAGLFFLVAVGASAVGVAGARWLLGKPLRTWWYLAPLVIFAMGAGGLTLATLVRPWASAAA